LQLFFLVGGVGGRLLRGVAPALLGDLLLLLGLSSAQNPAPLSASFSELGYLF